MFVVYSVMLHVIPKVLIYSLVLFGLILPVKTLKLYKNDPLFTVLMWHCHGNVIELQLKQLGIITVLLLTNKNQVILLEVW